MKKNLLLIPLLVLMSSCNNNQQVEKGNLNSTIFVCSDLHLLSKNLISEDNQTYRKEIFTSDGRVQELDYDLLESFIDEVNNKKPDAVCITGDLTFNGEKDSHLEVAKLLSTINEDIKVLVVPGNHDTFHLGSSSYINDKKENVANITKDEFKEIYNDFGYSNAISYDNDSLSYFYKINDSTMALMLDSTISQFNYDFDYNYVGGALSDNTFSWLEEQLNNAYQNNINVIGFMHHNLIDHNPLFC